MKMLLLEDMSTSKVKRALSTLAKNPVVAPSISVRSYLWSKKKWQKRAEVVVNLKYELSLLLLSLHPSI